MQPTLTAYFQGLKVSLPLLHLRILLLSLEELFNPCQLLLLLGLKFLVNLLHDFSDLGIEDVFKFLIHFVPFTCLLVLVRADLFEALVLDDADPR